MVRFREPDEEPDEQPDRATWTPSGETGRTHRPRLLRARSSALLSDHVIPDLRETKLSVWLCCCMATTLPAAMTLLITSDMTPLGREAFSHVWLLNDVLGAMLNQTVDNEIPFGIIKTDSIGYTTFYTLAGVGIVLFFFVDIQKWRFACLKIIYIILVLAVLLTAVVLHAEKNPWLWIIIGVAATMLNLTGLRKCCFREKPDFRAFNFVVATVLCLHSIVLGVLWVLWAFSPWLGFHTEADGLVEGTAVDGTALTYIFLWLSPAILSALYFICALFVFARCQFHVPETGNLHIGAGAIDNVYVGAELKFALYCLIFVACLVWIGVSVAGRGAGLSDVVMQMSGALFFLIALYIFIPIGPERVIAAAKGHEWVKYIVSLITNDWMKAVFILLLWPAIPLYFFVECTPQASRKMLYTCHLIAAPGGTCCLTESSVKRKKTTRSLGLGLGITEEPSRRHFLLRLAGGRVVGHNYLVVLAGGDNQALANGIYPWHSLCGGTDNVFDPCSSRTAHLPCCRHRSGAAVQK